MILALLAGAAAAAGPIAPHGPSWAGDPGGKTGWAVAWLGDINGDGRGDFAYGAPLEADGRVIIRTSIEGAPTHVLEGNAPDEQFGTALAPVGDVDGDGRPDIAVGAPLAPGIGGAPPRAGRVYVFLTSQIPSAGGAWPPALTIGGDTIDARLGMALAGGGDATGDGAPDLVASAPQAFGDAGLVALVPLHARGERALSSIAAAIVTGEAGDEIGESLAMSGARWLVGAPDAGAEGRAYLLEGAASGPVASAATRTWSGAHAGDGFGFDVLLVGERAIVGAPFAREADGEARVLDVGTGALVSIVRGTAAGSAGSSLAWGDFDGDGADDLVLGAPTAQRATASPGAIAFLPGPLAPEVDAGARAGRIFGAVGSGRFGFDVAIVPSPDDVHPAGILVGAPRVGPQAHLVLNLPPIAIPAPVEIPCTGPLTNVTLDGSASTDPDGAADIVAFEWRGPGGFRSDKPVVEVSVPVGSPAFTLRVEDVLLAADEAVAQVRVRDDGRPSVAFTRLDPAAIYLEDQEPIAGLRLPLILFATQIGVGTYHVAAGDECSAIERVEFYLDDVLVHVDHEAPYAWTRDPHEILPAFDRVRALAYDAVGLSAEACIPALDAGWISLHHLPILGEGPPPFDEWGIPPREIIGAGTPCENEWWLPIVHEPVPIENVLGI